MKRYSTERDDPPFEYDTGEYVLYEEARQIEVDRDIKAANLQLLVEHVLDVDETTKRAVEQGGDGGDVYDAEQAYQAMIELARSLKQ